MSHSIFGRSFGRAAFTGQAIPPITLAVYSRDLTLEKLRTYLRNTLPPGIASGGARVVKILDGEFLVYPDGTAQFVQVGRNPGPLFQWKDDQVAAGILAPPVEMDFFGRIRPENWR